MKKMTFLAALLGVTHFSNAQVGIGTATPADAAQLEISAINKGVLIPRVELRNTTTFGPAVTGTEIESLLVYNTAVAGSGNTAVTPGFYYWVSAQTTPAVPAHWERIVNQTQLNEAIGDITDLQGDISKIIELLKVAFPSNNLVDPSVDGDTHGGGMVFIPGATPTIEYVYFDGTEYVTKDITEDIIDIIKGAESKTTIIEFPADSGKYYYISEETINENDGVVPTSPFSSGTTLRPGVVLLDVPQSVINNFQTILDGTTTIVKPGTTNEYYTVEEIIKLIASQVEGNVIYTEVGGDMVFQYWDGTEYQTINLTDLVGAAQSKTTIVTYEDNQYYLSEAYILAGGETDPVNWTAVPTGAILIDVVGGVINNFNDFVTNHEVAVGGDTYNTVEEYIQYISENAMQNGVTRIVIDTTTSQASFETWNGTTWSPVATAAFSNIVKQNQSLTDIATTNVNNVIQYVYTAEPNLDGTARTFTLELTSDLISLINNNTDVRNAITNLTNDGVYYNGTGANLTVGTTVIPAGSLYTIDNNGNGVLIDLGDIVVNEVVENFNTIVNRSVTVDGNTYTTVKEYIQYLSETSDANVGYTVTGILAAENNGVAIPANSFYYIDKLTGNKIAIDLAALVKANETQTTIGKSADNSAYVQVTTDPKAVDKIVYEYVTENATVKNYMDITADVEWSIINNEGVRNAITNVLNQGGNVYFTRTAIAADTPSGQAAIPAFSFYTVNATTGVKELVDIAQTIVNAITNATDVQKQEIKNQLGDNFQNSAVVNTGDTWIDGGKIYRGIFDATVTGGSANVSAITLTGGTIGNVIGIKILNPSTNQIINTATTDVALATDSLTFRIGTGNMYNVLSDVDLDIKVIVEYSVTQ